MKKQEVIEAIENERTNCDDTIFGGAYDEAIDDTLAIVRQLDEPEKPVVPQFVADWYEDNEDGFEFNLYILCLDYNNYEVDKKLSDWFCDKHNKPLETLVNMHQFGYEVEKEKLYTVKIPNPNKIGNEVYALMKNGFKDIIIKIEFGDDYKKQKAFQLTEAEIKKDFDWAWQFAKEVKE